MKQLKKIVNNKLIISYLFMPFFTYKAINNTSGKKAFGSIEAKNEESVYRALAEKGLSIISLKKKISFSGFAISKAK